MSSNLQSLPSPDPYRVPPKKKRGANSPKRTRAASPTPSEQEILNALPDADDLVNCTEQKSPSFVIPAYLIYVVLRIDPEKIPSIINRKASELKTEGAEALKREYTAWTASIYPECHTEQELSRSYLINLIDAKKAETSIFPASVVPDPTVQDTVYIGKGKVEYEIIHRDHKEMGKEDPRQRKVVIVCKKTRYEAL